MSKWILSIVGIIFIGAIIELIMPSNKIKNLIKSVYALIFLYVFISPILQISKLDYGTDSINIDSTYLSEIYNSKIYFYEQRISEDLENEGILNVNVEIIGNIKDDEMIVNCIYVNLQNLVLTDESKHIDIYEQIYIVISNYVNVEKDKVYYNE